MIGFLRGRLAVKQPPQLLIDVGGVGYEVEAPMSTFYNLPETGSEVELLTHLVVRDDAHILFGFLTHSERKLFRNLIKVSGVGAKMALGVLSGISASEFAVCVREGDTTRLTRLPGIGKKTAERLVVEMRDRLEGAVDASAEHPGSQQASTPAQPADEAFDALVALGYKPREASRMVAAVDHRELNSEEIIRQALRGAARQ
ncbi:Holliday junction branch migration protein RuvA [Natronospira bacteriovora]|uniref:Holliday junction branch migration complex subunit RuvA n=1 Tax=Natronospira bacteriovora TaxID=3069753 RepID=A0ABU0W3M5_9GAMM|nr:Holliday junction branch migration protein RuvA [Natronospira sp. AB-CW4]MDQ2068513.1 Holliday junction branch migration protein RuvA [Natronospira sp. AB-CW4]